jgi:hypothetical protein
MHVCCYCKSEFYDKCNLNKHQRTSKYCLKIQVEKQPDKINNIIEYHCDYCKKQLSTQYSLATHLTTCKTKKKKEEKEEKENKLKSVEEDVKKLKDEIIQLKEKPTTTIINTDNSVNTINQHNYTSLLDYKTESITETFKKHYTKIEHLLKSDQKHLADITVQHVLSGKENPMYFVTDRSRNKFMYTDKENNEKEDANASLLRSLVYRGIKPIIKNLYYKEFKRLRSDLAEYQRRDNGDLIASTRQDLKELEEAYQQMDIIQESDDYISQLSRCLPTSIRDRLYHDNLEIEAKIANYDSDEEFKRELEREVRMIGDYSAVELQKFKDLYKETGETKGPPSIIKNPKYLQEYFQFLSEK